MTLEEIQKRVAEIEACKGDDEGAHGLEDALYAEFIEYVSTLEIPTLAAKAKLVLSTGKICFARWCA